MPRTSSRNNQTKTSGVGSNRGTNISNLTEDQQQQVAQLKNELTFYQEQLKMAKKKRRKVKEVIDNLEKIIVGDVILDILPDENSDEIMNSLIISKSDIINKLNGINTSEIFEEITIQEFVPYTGTYGSGQYVDRTELVGTGVTVSGYTPTDISKATELLDSIMKKTIVQELIAQSTELNENELYLPVYRQYINDSPSSIESKEVLLDVLSEIENNFL